MFGLFKKKLEAPPFSVDLQRPIDEALAVWPRDGSGITVTALGKMWLCSDQIAQLCCGSNRYEFSVYLQAGSPESVEVVVLDGVARLAHATRSYRKWLQGDEGGIALACAAEIESSRSTVNSVHVSTGFWPRHTRFGDRENLESLSVQGVEVRHSIGSDGEHLSIKVDVERGCQAGASAVVDHGGNIMGETIQLLVALQNQLATVYEQCSVEGTLFVEEERAA